jgi:Transcriptional regulators
MVQYTEFGAEARKIMLIKNMKMKDVAKELGVSTSYVSEILRGTRAGEKYKPRIAELLGMNLEEVS